MNDPYNNNEFFKKLWDAGLSQHIPKDFCPESYYDAGVLRKEDLNDGEYYQGECRNSSLAMWDAENNCFWYMRTKFTSTYKESINHLSDDNEHDLFIPFKHIKEVPAEYIIK